MKTCKVFVPCGALGTGIEPKSFQRGVDLNPDIISLDAGSTDSGPYYLGTANPKYARDSVKSDLKQILVAAQERDIPVTIGSSWPLRYLTKGVLRETLSGTQSSEVYPGTSRYSLKV